MFVVRIRGYAYLVPFVETTSEVFLKTIIPSRGQPANIWRRTGEMDKERKLEEEILASFERDEWQSVPNLKKEIARYASKDKRINIRISSRDLEDIQARAAEEGIPYQTLMASVLHKFVTGRLVEPPPPTSSRDTDAPKSGAPVSLGGIGQLDRMQRSGIRESGVMNLPDSAKLIRATLAEREG